MFEKSAEYWLVLVGMTMWVATHGESQSLKQRAAKTGISALLAVGISPSLAPFLHDSEIWATVFIMSLGLLTLDAASAVLADKELVKEMVRKYLGGKKND